MKNQVPMKRILFVVAAFSAASLNVIAQETPPAPPPDAPPAADQSAPPPPDAPPPAADQSEAPPPDAPPPAPAAEQGAPAPAVPDSATAAAPEEKKKSNKLELSSEDGSFKVKPLLLVQPALVIPVDSDADHAAAGSGMVLKRARLGFNGTLFKIAKIKLWGDFKKGSPSLVDAYTDIDPLEGKLVIRAGWFRPWFGRQRLGSSSKFQFVETAQAWSDSQLGLNLNRDLGLSLFGTAAGMLEWGLGMYNGEKSFSLGENRDFGLAARFAIHPLAAAKVGEMLKAGDETAFSMSKRPALSIGAALSYERRKDQSVTPVGAVDPLAYSDNQLKVGGEVAFQWSRLSLASEVFWMKTLLDDDTDDEISAAVDALGPSASVRGVGMGAYFQTGVMVVPEIFELAGRFDWVDEHLDTDGSRFYPAFAANIYIRGHNLKVQTFYRADVTTGYEGEDDSASHLFEIMIQVAF